MLIMVRDLRGWPMLENMPIHTEDLFLYQHVVWMGDQEMEQKCWVKTFTSLLDQIIHQG